MRRTNKIIIFTFRLTFSKISVSEAISTGMIDYNVIGKLLSTGMHNMVIPSFTSVFMFVFNN